MENQDKYFTPLDNDLQQLAMLDWVAFVKLIGEDAIIAAKVCLLKSRGRSLNQTASRLHITKSQVETRCKRCPVYSVGKQEVRD